MHIMFRVKNSIVTLFALALIAYGLGAPADTSNDYVQPPLVASYGDEPPKANARDYWSEQSQDDAQVQADPVNEDKEDADDGDSDSDDDKTDSNEVSPAPAESESHPVIIPSQSRGLFAVSGPKSHRIERRSPNKRPIRYRSKSYRRRQINDEE